MGASGGADEYRHLAGSYPKLLKLVLNENLTKTQKCYIIRYYRDGMTVTEIAQMYGVNKSTVSRTLKRARENLKRAIHCELVRKAAGSSRGRRNAAEVLAGRANSAEPKRVQEKK